MKRRTTIICSFPSKCCPRVFSLWLTSDVLINYSIPASASTSARRTFWSSSTNCSTQRSSTTWRTCCKSPRNSGSTIRCAAVSAALTRRPQANCTVIASCSAMLFFIRPLRWTSNIIVLSNKTQHTIIDEWCVCLWQPSTVHRPISLRMRVKFGGHLNSSHVSKPLDDSISTRVCPEVYSLSPLIDWYNNV